MKKKIAQLLSALALAATIIPPCLFFAGTLTRAAVQPWMLGAAALWFATAPLWMEHKATD